MRQRKLNQNQDSTQLCLGITNSPHYPSTSAPILVCFFICHVPISAEVKVPIITVAFIDVQRGNMEENGKVLCSAVSKGCISQRETSSESKSCPRAWCPTAPCPTAEPKPHLPWGGSGDRSPPGVSAPPAFLKGPILHALVPSVSYSWVSLEINHLLQGKVWVCVFVVSQCEQFKAELKTHRQQEGKGDICANSCTHSHCGHRHTPRMASRSWHGLQ